MWGVAPTQTGSHQRRCSRCRPESTVSLPEKQIQQTFTPQGAILGKFTVLPGDKKREMTLFSCLCSKTEARTGNQNVYHIIKRVSLRKWLCLPTYSSYGMWSALPNGSNYSFKVVHLVWNVVPVVVKGVDAAVGECQDHQVVAGPGRVQEDDDGSYDCHLQHRRPLPGLQRVVWKRMFFILTSHGTHVNCVKREKCSSP